MKIKRVAEESCKNPDKMAIWEEFNAVDFVFPYGFVSFFFSFPFLFLSVALK